MSQRCKPADEPWSWLWKHPQLSSPKSPRTPRSPLSEEAAAVDLEPAGMVADVVKPFAGMEVEAFKFQKAGCGHAALSTESTMLVSQLKLGLSSTTGYSTTMSSTSTGLLSKALPPLPQVECEAETMRVAVVSADTARASSCIGSGGHSRSCNCDKCAKKFQKTQGVSGDSWTACTRKVALRHGLLTVAKERGRSVSPRSWFGRSDASTEDTSAAAWDMAFHVEGAKITLMRHSVVVMPRSCSDKGRCLVLYPPTAASTGRWAAALCAASAKCRPRIPGEVHGAKPAESPDAASTTDHEHHEQMLAHFQDTRRSLEHYVAVRSGTATPRSQTGASSLAATSSAAATSTAPVASWAPEGCPIEKAACKLSMLSSAPKEQAAAPSAATEAEACGVDAQVGDRGTSAIHEGYPAVEQQLVAAPEVVVPSMFDWSVASKDIRELSESTTDAIAEPSLGGVEAKAETEASGPHSPGFVSDASASASEAGVAIQSEARWCPAAAGSDEAMTWRPSVARERSKVEKHLEAAERLTKALALLGS
eukprot:TRINITY_DN122733_c0_g1_i1.p1 TRINITY_DN122733_c0_g1~~TRINITY_DN122733_c0_g1_i1.p1  ORF type:complete len:546 (+),score=102.80 TRINITY_DN122733_c0_g1_i1:31-1638(+)